MKLWYSPMSPFVRKVLIAIKHHQLEDRIDMQKVPTGAADPNSPHNLDNPLGRIPALQRNCGRWLYGSLLITEYLDSKGKNNPLFIKEGKARWNALALHNLADGILENTAPVVIEKMKRAENEWWLERHHQLQDRNIKAFKKLEQDIQEFGTELNIGTLTAVAVIDWFQFRQQLVGLNLAESFPELIHWAETMNEKYSCLAETKPKL